MEDTKKEMKALAPHVLDALITTLARQATNAVGWKRAAAEDMLQMAFNVKGDR